MIVGSIAANRRRAGAVVYDIILVAADSYGVGVNARAGGDVLNSNVYQFNSDPGGARYRTITQDLPLYNPNGSETGSTGVTNPLSIAETIANAHATRTGNPTLIVPFSWNGTNLMNTGHSWQVGDTLHEGAITQTNLAITAAQAVHPGSRIVAIALLDSGLANDAQQFSVAGTSPPGTAINKAATKTMLGTVIADFRSRITGASSVPILFHALPPEMIASYNNGSLAQARDCSDCIREYAASATGVYFVDVPPSYSSDNLHLNNAGIRLIGPLLDSIMADATAPTISTPNTFSGSDGSPINIVLAANEYVTWSCATGGWEIVRTFGGSTGITSAYPPTWTLRLTSNANASYSSPPANPTIVARDGAGNTTSETIAVTIAAPYGVGDQGPVTAAYTGFVQDTNSYFGSSTITLSIPLAAGLNLIYAQDEGGSADVAGITVGGATASKLVAGTGNPNGGSVWGIIMATAGTFSASIATGGGNGAIVNLSLTIGTMNGTKATPLATDFVTPSGTNHSPVTGASETCPTSGMIVGFGYIPSPSGPGTGCTAVGTNAKAFFIKRTTTGALSYAGADGTSQLSTLVFEKSV